MTERRKGAVPSSLHRIGPDAGWERPLSVLSSRVPSSVRAGAVSGAAPRRNRVRDPPGGPRGPVRTPGDRTPLAALLRGRGRLLHTAPAPGRQALLPRHV